MKVVSHSAIYFFGEVFSKIIPFLMLPYLTRTLGSDGFGNLAFYLVVYSLSLVLISISQDGAVARYYFRYGKRSVPSVICAGFVYSVCASLLITLALIVSGNGEYVMTVFLALTQTVISTALSLRQCMRRPVSYTIVQLFVSSSVAGLTIVGFEFFEASALMRLNSMVVGNICAIVLTQLLTDPKFVYPNVSLLVWRRHFQYVIGFGIPLIIHQLSFFGKGQFDRFLIPKAFSVEALGLYSASFQLASIVTVILYAINKAIVPVLYGKIKDGIVGPIETLKYAFASLLIVPLPSLVAGAVPDGIYSLVLGDGFDGAKYFVVSFLFGLMLHLPYQFLANFYFYHGKNVIVATVTFISVLVHVFLVAIAATLKLFTILPFVIFISNSVGALLLISIIYFQRSMYQKGDFK